MWKEQVKKAFFLCWAERNLKIVLMMQEYDRTMQVRVIFRISTAQIITVCSINHVSEHEIFTKGNASQPKWSVLLESQNFRFKLRLRDFPGGSDGKAAAYNAGDLGSIPGSGRSPEEGNGNPLQYSCLENPMNGGSC